MMDETLGRFKPAAPPPGLKDRVLGAARAAAAPALIDRLWTRRTWLGLAAAFLVALAFNLVTDRRPAGAVPGTALARPRGSEDRSLTMLEARRRAFDLLEGRNLQ